MPALPNVANCVRVDLKGTLDNGAPWQNRLFYAFTGTMTQADLTTWANAIITRFTNVTGPIALFCASYTFTGVELTDLTTVSSPQVAVSTAVAGGHSGTAVPNGVAAVISFRTARRYRGGHPRIYLGGLPAGNLTNADSWSTAALSAYLGQYTALTAGIGSDCPGGESPASQVNVSYYHGFTNVTFPSGRTRPVPTLRSTPIREAITGISVNPKTASQRRRNQQRK